MIASYKHKFLTVDIPKTGTRTLRETLAPLKVISILGEPNTQSEFYQHDKLSRIKKTFDIKFKQTNDPIWDINKYYIFTIIRNPWSRYFSFFNYFKTASENYENFLSGNVKGWTEAQIHQGKTSYSFFNNGLSKKDLMKRIVQNNDDQGSFFIYNDHVHVNHVARFEDLKSEILGFCDLFSLENPTVTHGNKGEYSTTMNEFYDQEIVDLIAEREKVLLKHYNFNYDN
jgi:hypothetical protein